MTSARQQNPTIRISARTHETVKQLAEENKTSMGEIVEEAIERYRRERIVQQANEAWAKAMKDPEVRKAWEREDALLEGTLMDGLEDDEQWK